MDGEQNALVSQDNSPEVNLQVLELEKQKDKHQFEIAKMNLEALAKDSTEMRTHFAGNRKSGTVIMLAIIGTVFIFCMCALFLGKDAFISDLFKIVLGSIGGGGFGYVLGFRRGKMTEK